MSSSPSNPTSRPLRLGQRPTGAALSAAAVFVGIAVFDLVAHPADQGALRPYKEYLLTVTIFPGAAVMLWVLSALHGLDRSHTGRLGRAGLRVATVGLLGLVVDAIVTIASGSTDTIGPQYPLAMLATLIGVVLMATQWHRASVLPRWIGPTVGLGWFLGASPVLGFGGAMLILAAALLAIAVGLRRQTHARLAAPVELDRAVTA